MNNFYIDISNNEHITITDARAMVKGFAKVARYTDPFTHKTRYWYETELKGIKSKSEPMSKQKAIKEIRKLVDEAYKEDLKEYQYY